MVNGSIVNFRLRLMETCCSCCTCVNRDAPRTRQIYTMLENIETYKRQQLEKLRENYAVQVSVRFMTTYDAFVLRVVRLT